MSWRHLSAVFKRIRWL